jgi:hypothetical protein
MTASRSPDQYPLDQLIWNRQLISVFQRLISAVLLACLMVPVAQVVYHVLGIRPVNFLFPLVFVIALESMASHSRMRTVSIDNPQWWLYHLAEWVVLVVLLKLFLYALNGFDRLLFDFPLWRADFFLFFYDPEYLFLLSMVAGVWVISSELDNMFNLINADEKLLKVESDSGFSEQRMETRSQLANMIVAGGGFMIALAAILNLASGGSWTTSSQASQSVLALVVYFLCGLVLLSLTQFSVLRARWVINHVPIEPRITTHWFGYCFGLVVCLAIFAVFLPTAYSNQLLQALQLGFAYLILIIQVIVYFLLYPFVLLFGWLMKLFNHPVAAQPAPPARLYPLPDFVPGEPNAWLEWVKTVLFWVVLVGLVGYAFIYYFREHPEYVNWLQRSRFFSGIIHFGRGILSWLRGVNQQAAFAIENSLRRLRTRTASGVGAIQLRYTNPRLLPPREQMRFYYLALVRRATEQGLPRQAYQTPNEYSEQLKATIINPPLTRSLAKSPATEQPELESLADTQVVLDLSSLTEGFIEARYSQHEITGAQVNRVRQAWEHLLRTLRSWRD